MKRYKRLDLAIEAVRLLSTKYPDLRLQIIGTGTDLERLKATARRNGLENRVGFLGRVNDIQLRHFYRASWANVQPSAAEGWGFTVLEAAACGTPTVAFNNSVFPETVGPFCRKYLARDGDVLALADSIDRCLADVESSPNEVSSRQVAYAREFSWDVTTSNFESVFHKARSLI